MKFLVLLVLAVPAFAASFEFSGFVETGNEDIINCTDGFSVSGIGSLVDNFSCFTEALSTTSIATTDLQGVIETQLESFESPFFAASNGSFALTGLYTLKTGTGIQTVTLPGFDYFAADGFAACEWIINGTSVGCDGGSVQLDASRRFLMKLHFSYDLYANGGNGNIARLTYDLSPFFVSAGEQDPTRTPEPSTLLLVPAGLVGLAAWRARKRA